MRDTGHVGLAEPFAGLFTQGMVVHETYRRTDGTWASPAEVRVEGEGSLRKAYDIATDEEVTIGPIEKMSKSKRNTVGPEDITARYGADTARSPMSPKTSAVCGSTAASLIYMSAPMR